MKTKFSLLFSSLLLISFVFFMCQKEDSSTAKLDNESQTLYERTTYSPSKEEIVSFLDSHFAKTENEKFNSLKNFTSFVKTISEQNLMFYEGEFQKRVCIKHGIDGIIDFSSYLSLREEIMAEFNEKCIERYGKSFMVLNDQESDYAYSNLMDSQKIEQLQSLFVGTQIESLLNNDCWDLGSGCDIYPHTGAPYSEIKTYLPDAVHCVRNDPQNPNEDCDTEFRFFINYSSSSLVRTCPVRWSHNDPDFVSFSQGMFGTNGFLATRNYTDQNTVVYTLVLGKRFMNWAGIHPAWTSIFHFDNLYITLDYELCEYRDPSNDDLN